MLYMRHLCIAIALLFLNLAHSVSLHEAIRTNNTKEFNKLASDENYLNEQDPLGNTPAHVAVIEGKIAYLKSLKDKGANLRLTNRLGDNLLHTFIKHGDSHEVFRFLLGQNFLLNDKNNESKDDDSQELLLDENNNESKDDDSLLDEKNYGGKTPLILAIEKGDLGQVKALIKNKASPNIANSEGETAFLIAVLLDDENIIATLLNSPIQIEFQEEDFEGRSPIGVVVARGNIGMAIQFFSHGADVNFVNLFGQTLLHISVAHGHADMTQFLLDQKKIPVDAQDVDGNTALILAAARGSLKEVSALISHGADSTKINKNGKDALYDITENKERAQRVAQKITELGLEDADKYENAPSHHFLQDMNVQLLEYFLENFKVRGDLENNDGRVALDLLTAQENILKEVGNQQQVLQVLNRARDNDSGACQGEFK